MTASHDDRPCRKPIHTASNYCRGLVNVGLAMIRMTAPRRTFTLSDFRQKTLPGRQLTLPFPLGSSMEDAATCPQAIIDTDPSESGLGIWVLVGTEPGKCIYEYAGGIV